MIALAEKFDSDAEKRAAAADRALAAASSALDAARAEDAALRKAESRSPSTLEAIEGILERREIVDRKIAAATRKALLARQAKEAADRWRKDAGADAERAALDARCEAFAPEFLGAYERPAKAIVVAMATIWAIQKRVAKLRGRAADGDFGPPAPLISDDFCNALRLPNLTKKHGLRGYLHYPSAPQKLEGRAPDEECLAALAPRIGDADAVEGAIRQLTGRYEASVREIARLIKAEIAIERQIDAFNMTRRAGRLPAVVAPAGRMTNWYAFRDHIVLPTPSGRGKPFYSPVAGMAPELERSL
jgi:hypothetical protein